MLKIGVSSCIFHADPTRPVFKGKTLFYLEKSIATWLNSQHALVFMIPGVDSDSGIHLKDLVREMDGILLQGGVDVAPESYGEKPLKPEWKGDSIRDAYEIDLLQEATKKGKPLLGICRGAQIMNVAFGGTLYQDIKTQLPQAFEHRNWEIYDQNTHEIAFTRGSKLQSLYPSQNKATVNSVHHQAIKDLGTGLLIEARSVSDGLAEAVRLDSENYISAVQWHPEFHDPKNSLFLDSAPLLKDFLTEVQKRKKR